MLELRANGENPKERVKKGLTMLQPSNVAVLEITIDPASNASEISLREEAIESLDSVGVQTKIENALSFIDGDDEQLANARSIEVRARSVTSESEPESESESGSDTAASDGSESDSVGSDESEDKSGDESEESESDADAPDLDGGDGRGDESSSEPDYKRELAKSAAPAVGSKSHIAIASLSTRYWRTADEISDASEGVLSKESVSRLVTAFDHDREAYPDVIESKENVSDGDSQCWVGYRLTDFGAKVREVLPSIREAKRMRSRLEDGGESEDEPEESAGDESTESAESGGQSELEEMFVSAED